MAASLHGSACTTPQVRAELEVAQVSSRTLATQYGSAALARANGKSIDESLWLTTKPQAHHSATVAISSTSRTGLIRRPREVVFSSKDRRLAAALPKATHVAHLHRPVRSYRELPKVLQHMPRVVVTDKLNRVHARCGIPCGTTVPMML